MEDINQQNADQFSKDKASMLVNKYGKTNAKIYCKNQIFANEKHNGGISSYWSDVLRYIELDGTTT